MVVAAHTEQSDNSSPHALQRRLLRLNTLRFSPRQNVADSQAWLRQEMRLREQEVAWIEAERAAVAGRAAQAPRDAAQFIAWFDALQIGGPGQGDPLFAWLAQDATWSQFRWFLQQEIAGEQGFDDLVALSQIRLPERAKLELARNYWDEMGRGKAGGMHGPMLHALAQAFKLSDDHSEVVWEALAVGNTMTALAANRPYAYQSLGALGAVELTAPGRAKLVDEGLRRLGLGGEARRYFAVHATLDIKHSEAWNSEVLVPLVTEEPRVAPLIAEGALLRLRAGARAFERYRQVLWQHPALSAGLFASPVRHATH